MSKLLLFLLVLFTVFVYPDIKKVRADGASIQMNIDASKDGDTVLVSEGTYYENINFHGKKIIVASLFLTTNDFYYVKNTIINGSQPLNSDTASCVLFISGEDSSSQLIGFTLTGGKGTRWTDEHGAGIYYEGGGVFSALSSPTIKNNIIIDNEAIRKSNSASAGGGGLRCGDGAPHILNNVIINNRGMYGGGIVLNYCAGAVVKNNIVVQNSVYQAVASTPTYGGGGLWINNQLPGNNAENIIENNIFFGNTSSGTTPAGWAGYGGGVYITQSNVVFDNNVIWSNKQDKGKQLYVPIGNVSITYNDVQDSTVGIGNISVDPSFTDSCFYLGDSSPLIDAGNPDTLKNDVADPMNPGKALYPSKGTTKGDIGTFGGPGSTDLPCVSLVQPSNIDDFSSPVSFELQQNYPNPFNPSTLIKYSVASAEFTSVKVFNIAGEEVVTLVNEFKLPGHYEVTWNGKNNAGRLMSSGVYFYRIVSGEFNEVKKMLLLK